MSAAAAQQRRSVIKPSVLARPRKLNKVPFVELYGGRLQGVVSAGSDENRVYVAYFQGGTGNFYCSTNLNNRCASLRGGPCKHQGWMMDEAFLQFGAARIVTYLGLAVADPDKVKSGGDLIRYIKGGEQKVDAAMVFSRFLTYLHHVNLPPTTAPVPEMNWFVR